MSVCLCVCVCTVCVWVWVRVCVGVCVCVSVCEMKFNEYMKFNTYMKFNDPFPSARAFKTLLCGTSNKGRLQNLICRHLTDLAQSVHAEIIYSVGSDCTNLSTQEPMPDYSFSQSEADTILFFTYIVLRDSGYNGPVVIDSADTDAYVAAAAISKNSLACSA